MNYKPSTIFMPILREVLGTGRKKVALSFTEETLCVLLGFTNLHLLIPFHLQIKGVIVVLLRPEKAIGRPERLAGEMFPLSIPPSVFRKSQGTPQVTAATRE
jgi:hypothetical protein